MKQKSEKARAARGRQTSQQKTKQEPLIRSTWEPRDRIASDTGYDTVDKRIRRDTQLEDDLVVQPQFCFDQALKLALYT